MYTNYPVMQFFVHCLEDEQKRRWCQQCPELQAFRDELALLLSQAGEVTCERVENAGTRFGIVTVLTEKWLELDGARIFLGSEEVEPDDKEGPSPGSKNRILLDDLRRYLFDEELPRQSDEDDQAKEQVS